MPQCPTVNIGISASFMRSEATFRNAGISRVARQLVDALVRSAEPDERYHLFLHEGYAGSEGWDRLPQVTLHPIVPEPREKRALWEAFRAPRVARSLGIDVWFSTTHMLPLGRSLPRVPFVHDLIAVKYPELFGWKQALYLKWALKYACTRSTRVLTNSEATKVDIVATYGTSPDRIVVSGLGPGNVFARLDPASVSDEELQALGLPWNRFLLAIGTLEPRKNLSRLLQAMPLLADSDLGLAIAGGRGWKESAIFTQVQELGIGDRVAFLGYVEDADLSRLLARTEAFVFPSLYEGFGMPILEAMLAGAPVLASARPAMEEVGGNVARYFDPADPAAIASAISEVTSDPELVRSMREAGPIRAEQFTWQRAAAITRATLREVAR